MTVTLETWHVISLLLTLAGGGYAMAQAFFGRFEKSLLERDKQLSASLDKIDSRLSKETDEIRRIDRELLQLKADIPRDYVSKNDFNRAFTVVDAKLDRLYVLYNNKDDKG